MASQRRDSSLPIAAYLAGRCFPASRRIFRGRHGCFLASFLELALLFVWRRDGTVCLGDEGKGQGEEMQRAPLQEQCRLSSGQVLHWLLQRQCKMHRCQKWWQMRRRRWEQRQPQHWRGQKVCWPEECRAAIPAKAPSLRLQWKEVEKIKGTVDRKTENAV